ncbi:leiomodin-3 [Seriola lalandi dorsalis]|uniref:leiomodin-3 n=1 Tax=Seriola lalandi dorsalis TaxID=1841481 RepID=UPI000C6F47E5|nr:leiomodin-3 [Seriola lalandi dorsalis]XP_056240593.1 leiomodin-3 [Seriola aureovittata]
MSNSRDIDDLNEEDIDEDELLAMLSPEELKELQSEMDVIIAPDESVPVGQRQKDQTEKTPTGTFDHRSLVDYLYWEKESKRMLEEERVPATLLPSEKTLREEAEKKEEEEETVKYEEYEVIEEIIVEEAVDGADGEEIIEEIIEEIVEEVDERDEMDKEVDEKDEREVKLPVNTDEHENTDKHVRPLDNNTETVTENNTDGNQPFSDVEEKAESSAPKHSASHVEEKEEIKMTDSLPPKDTPEETEINESSDKLPQKEERKINKLKIPKLALNNIKMTSRPSGNETNLDSTLDKIRNNHPSVTEVNLNNIENIPKEMLLDYVNALKKNKHVKTFSIANTGVDENIAFNLANMLRENRSITTLNIESNFVTGKGIVAIIRCLQFNETLTELRFHNQRHMLGHHAEMEISRLIKANNTLLKMGYHFELPGPRMVVTNILTRNLDRQRQVRKEEQKQQQLKEQKELMQLYENTLNLPPGLLQMLGYIPPLELLQEHGLVPPSTDLSALPETQHQTEQPEPQMQLKQKRIPKQSSAEPANSLRDVQLKRTPKKRDPFLDLDPRDDRRPERFQLRRTSSVKDASSREMTDEKPNLTAVIKTLKPVPRRRVPPKVDLTPRDQLLSEIKKSNVAYLKPVPLPKVLESSETSLF